MSKNDQPSFLADKMLGSLARKLRLLGIDTAYAGDVDDSELKYIVRSRDRILLTKNRKLAGSLGDSAWLVEGDGVKEEFDSIVPEMSGAGCQFAPFSRCLDCNEPLAILDPSETEGKVPPYIQASQTHFSECPSCGKVFWEGTHRKRMEREVERMKGILEKGCRM
jgi:uncharacterized protein with PIN domain